MNAVIFVKLRSDLIKSVENNHPFTLLFFTRSPCILLLEINYNFACKSLCDFDKE